MMEEQMVVHKQDRPDSITIGTPGRNGEMKVYFNAAKPEETEALIRNAYEALKRARECMQES